MSPRLATGLWVAAYLARLQAAAIAVYVARRGDEAAGAVAVKLSTMDGTARAFVRVWDFATDQRHWTTLAQGDELGVDAALARALARDPDLWLIEVEDRQGRSLLDEDGLRGD